jgi:hypothetical protein
MCSGFGSRSACRCSHLRIWGQTRQPCKRRVCADIGRKNPRAEGVAVCRTHASNPSHVPHVAYSDEFGRRFQQCAAVCSDSIRPCIPIGFGRLFRYCAAIYRSEATKGISNVSLPVMSCKGLTCGGALAPSFRALIHCSAPSVRAWPRLFSWTLL